MFSRFYKNLQIFLGKQSLDTHRKLDINISATIVKAPLDTDRQGIHYATTPQSPGMRRYHTQLPRSQPLRAPHFLFGVVDNKDFSHRRDAIVQRLSELAELFCIDIAAYAIMSNHYRCISGCPASQPPKGSAPS